MCSRRSESYDPGLREYTTADNRRALNRFHVGFLAARVGEWVYLVALNWLTLVQFESATAVGIVNACRLLPVVLVSVPSGVLADRYNCRKLLSWIYAGCALLSVLVGWTLHAKQELVVVSLAVFLRELVAGMEPPARNLLLGQLCPGELPRALAANASVLNVGRVVGPAVGGYLLSCSTIPCLFGLASVGIFACSVSTWLQKQHGPGEARKRKGAGDMREVFAYIAGNPRLKLLIGLMIAPMFLAFPYLSLMPLFGKELLRCGPEGVGTLISLTAVGSLVSSATIIGNSTRVLRGGFQVVTLILFSLSLLAGVLAPNFATAAVAMFLAGASSQAYRTVSRILAQMGVPTAMQGRVVSLILMDRALIPLGTLVLGWWAEMFGVLSSGLLMSAGPALVTVALVILKPAIWSLQPPDEDCPESLDTGRVLAPGPT